MTIFVSYRGDRRQHLETSGKSHPCPHLLAIDPLQVEVVEAVNNEGTPQSQTNHWITLRVDGQLVQTPHLSQGCQLGQTADVGFQEDQVLQKKVMSWFKRPRNTKLLYIC